MLPHNRCDNENAQQIYYYYYLLKIVVLIARTMDSICFILSTQFYCSLIFLFCDKQIMIENHGVNIIKRHTRYKIILSKGSQQSMTDRHVALWDNRHLLLIITRLIYVHVATR